MDQLRPSGNCCMIENVFKPRDPGQVRIAMIRGWGFEKEIEMRIPRLLSAILLLLISCTCMDLSFLSGLLEDDGEPRGEMIEFGNEVQGSIGEGGVEYWSFTGDSGDQITISMESQDFDSFVALFGPDDQYLVCDDDSGGGLNARIRRFVLPSSGIFNIVAMAFWQDVGGDYTLELEQTGTDQTFDEIGGGSLEYGDSVREHLDIWTGDVWTFSGEAGDRVSIRMGSNDFDTYLDLWGPDLKRVTYNDDDGRGTNSFIDNVTLPLSGTYNIVARGYSTGETGNYSLSLE